MCIRDRAGNLYVVKEGIYRIEAKGGMISVAARQGDIQLGTCLLYTSDAADERSSVDLGGRRIIKKKKKRQSSRRRRRRRKYDTAKGSIEKDQERG